MLNKTFSVRSNAIRNARIALGKGAKQNVHFLIGGEKGAFTWSPIEGAPAVETAPAPEAEKPTEAATEAPKVTKRRQKSAKKTGPKAAARRRIVKTRKVNKVRGRKVGRRQLSSVVEVSGKRKKMFKLISSPSGASLNTLTNALGWQAHTVRGAVSTIGSQFKVKIKSFRDERRGRVYKVA